MNKAELNKLVFSAYNLGKRVVFHAHQMDIPAAETHKEWDLLREIAEGKTTLVGSPAEKVLKFPKMRPEMKEYLTHNTNKLLEQDRQLAMRVLQAFEDMMNH